MKTAKTIISALASVLVLSGCSNFLEEYNPVGLDTIYDTEDVLESSIYGVMNGFLGWYGVNGETVESFGIASGLLHWSTTGSGHYAKAKWESCLHFTQYSTNSWNGDYFKQLYVAVQAANALIANLKTSTVDDAYKLEIEAEARFYRAVAYFWIVRIWGDCPLRLEMDNAESATNFPRTPYYKVYEQIVSDFEFAEKNMRTPERVQQVTPRMARPNRYAATAFLSSVYTTIGSLLASPDDNFWNNSKPGRKPDFSALGIDKDDFALGARQAYTKALAYAEKLIPESSSFDASAPYRLLEKHGDLFNFDPEFSRNGYTAWINPEQIFTLSSTINSAVSVPYAKYVLPQYPEGTSAVIENTQYGRVRPTRWVFQKWCETYPGAVSTAYPDMMASSKDPRLDVTMYYGKMKYSNGSGTTSIYPATNSATSKAGAYPYIKKVASKRYNVNTSDADIYMMRFAELYFNAAEAAAYLDDEATARKYIEVIHARARHSVADGTADSAMPSWSGRTFADKEELTDALFWEWVFEFLGENQEYLYTHRHGARWIIRNICCPKNEFLTQPSQRSLIGNLYPPDFLYPEDYTADPDDPGLDVFLIRKGLLAAFPQSECLYNSAISEVENQNDYTY